MDKTLEQILAGVLQIPAEEVTSELTMMDLDCWDSLKHIELISTIEQQFDIQLTFEEIIAMRSVKDIKSALNTKGVLV